MPRRLMRSLAPRCSPVGKCRRPLASPIRALSRAPERRAPARCWSSRQIDLPSNWARRRVPANATRRVGARLDVLELDLIGQTVRLSEGAAGWLYAQAKAGSGSSIGARDLATRLRGLDPAQELNRLVLTRSESRALGRLLEAAEEAPDACDELRTSLSQLFAPN
jgi:hypothetical protein